MNLDNHYTDPRLVALYDLENLRGADTDFYLQLANELNAQRILDLGCGTGLLTCEFVQAERTITGVDPSPAMLNIARQKTNAKQVQWVEGTAAALGIPKADLLVMTGNVAQIYLEEAAWHTTLRAIHAALRPGGTLAFESRNPLAKAWEQWHQEPPYEMQTPLGKVKSWLEVGKVENGRVTFTGHNYFHDTDETLSSSSTLRFRTHAEISQSLTQTGFTIPHVYGDWHHTPFTENSKMMVFVAQRENL